MYIKKNIYLESENPQITESFMQLKLTKVYITSLY